MNNHIFYTLLDIAVLVILNRISVVHWKNLPLKIEIYGSSNLKV